MNAFALNVIEGDDDTQLAQRTAGAPWQVEAPGVGAIDDVHVVVARYEEDARSDVGAGCEEIEKLDPFRPCSGVGDVPRHEHAIEWRQRVNGAELVERVAHAHVA